LRKNYISLESRPKQPEFRAQLCSRFIVEGPQKGPFSTLKIQIAGRQAREKAGKMKKNEKNH
jgi:hypothetical protein